MIVTVRPITDGVVVSKDGRRACNTGEDEEQKKTVSHAEQCVR